MSLPAWVREHRAEARVARRLESIFGVRSTHDERSATLELPGRSGRLAGAGVRLGAKLGVRLDPGRRAALAVGVAALVAVLVAGCWVFVNRPRAIAVSSPSSVSSARTSVAASTDPAASPRPSASASASAAFVVVDVVGKVATPGVYRLPAGSRVTDAVKAAGGALPGVDLSTINLAQVVSDGEQIAVAVPGAPNVGTNGGGTGAAAGPIDLNSASATQLDALPGVGPVLAQHIIDWRTQHGRFASVDQLREVSGIGEAKYADLKSLVKV